MNSTRTDFQKKNIAEGSIKSHTARPAERMIHDYELQCKYYLLIGILTFEQGLAVQAPASQVIIW
jgi:hypothetical protein